MPARTTTPAAPAIQANVIHVSRGWEWRNSIGGILATGAGAESRGGRGCEAEQGAGVIRYNGCCGEY
jgi:hypothetical protein